MLWESYRVLLLSRDLGGPVTPRLMVWVKYKYKRLLRQARSSRTLSPLSGLQFSSLPGMYSFVLLLPKKSGDLLLLPWLLSLWCRWEERIKDLFLQTGSVRFLRRCTCCLIQVIHYCQNITSNGTRSHPRPLTRQTGMVNDCCVAGYCFMFLSMNLIWHHKFLYQGLSISTYQKKQRLSVHWLPAAS